MTNPTAKIYLGSPFYTDAERARVPKAKELLAKNPTVLNVHFPFDQNFVDPEEKKSRNWRHSLNDLACRHVSK